VSLLRLVHSHTRLEVVTCPHECSVPGCADLAAACESWVLHRAPVHRCERACRGCSAQRLPATDPVTAAIPGSHSRMSHIVRRMWCTSEVKLDSIGHAMATYWECYCMQPSIGVRLQGTANTCGSAILHHGQHVNQTAGRTMSVRI
jgi:hypothetical protein